LALASASAFGIVFGICFSPWPWMLWPWPRHCIPWSCQHPCPNLP